MVLIVRLFGGKETFYLERHFLMIWWCLKLRIELLARYTLGRTP